MPKRLTLEQANVKLTKAYQAYFKARPTFSLWRDEFQRRLIKALTIDKDRTIAQIEAQIQQENHQKDMG